MFNAFRPAFLIALLALPLAGCEGIAHAPLELAATHGGVVRPGAAVVTAERPSTPTLDRAKSLFAAGNFGLAADAYKSAVETGPSNAEAWIGLAAAYDELGRFDLADRAYGAALRITGPTAQVLNNRGYSRLLRGDYAQARRDLLAARARDPKNPQIAQNLRLLRR